MVGCRAPTLRKVREVPCVRAGHAATAPARSELSERPLAQSHYEDEGRMGPETDRRYHQDAQIFRGRPKNERKNGDEGARLGPASNQGQR